MTLAQHDEAPQWLVDLLNNHKAAIENQGEALVRLTGALLVQKFAIEVLINSHPTPRAAVSLWLQQKDEQIEKHVGGPSFAPGGAVPFRQGFVSTWSSLESSLRAACSSEGGQ